jgi:hypothetical protein
MENGGRLIRRREKAAGKLASTSLRRMPQDLFLTEQAAILSRLVLGGSRSRNLSSRLSRYRPSVRRNFF